MRRIVSFAIIALLSATAPLAADELHLPLRPYDSIQAGLDAHAGGEARRLDAIDRQLGWNQLFRWQAATQTSSSIYYNPYIPGFDYGGGLSGGWLPSALDYRPIWGYGYYEATGQPIGQRQMQTGPNRWESHPIYGDEDIPAVVAPVAKPAPRGREF